MAPIDKATLERMAFKAQGVPDGQLCPRCGYELTGLAPDGQCPECGSPIEFALRPDYLRFSDPAYVGRLHIGAVLIVLSLVIVILSAILGFSLAIFGGLLASTPILLLIGFGSSVVSLVGWWLLSSPDPGKADIDFGASSRKVLRVLLIVKAGSALFELVVMLTGVTITSQSANTAIDLVGTLAGPASFIASMLYLKTLAFRMPSEEIASRSRTVLWLAVVLFVLTGVVATGVGLAGSGGTGGGIGLGVLGCFGIPVAIAWIVFFVMYISLLDSTRRMLNEIRGWM